ncbi:MAG TPA: tRNA lysidine(34) synthetase TilS [Anaerolineae bacterium]|nr:tRNA lysidine(34) synthetase TilS [Anaerolineae bacterium]
MELLQRVRKTIERHNLLAGGDTVVVGVSGGPDSLCLLHILCRLGNDYALALHVAHLNHCLRGAEADEDQAFVVELADRWGLPAHAESQDIAALAKERKLAVEEAARQVRYAFLARVAVRVGAQRIAVGHNADDQVETVLMHWLRGAGPAGLRGMQPVSGLDELRLEGEELTHREGGSNLLLIRPLLDVPRSAIEAYCTTRDLRPRFDRSNLDTTYYRNRLRHELLPHLETYNPRIREVILRTAAIIAGDYAYLRQQVVGAWTDVVVLESARAVAFDLGRWRALPLSLQRSLLREAIRRLRRSLRNIGWVHVDNAIGVLQRGSTGACATLPRGLEARLGYHQVIVADKAYVEPVPDFPLLQEQVPLRVPGTTRLPVSDWELTVRIVDWATFDRQDLSHDNPWQAYLDCDIAGKVLCLRPRQAGDRFWPQGLGEKPTRVSSFMTNAKIPRAWRDSIPLLVRTPEPVLRADEGSRPLILWLAGWRIDDRAKVTNTTQRVLHLAFSKVGENDS